MNELEGAALVRARFGLPMHLGAIDERRETLRANAESCAIGLDETLAPGQIAIVIGPSGSGKSMVLDAFAKLTGPCVHAEPILASTLTPVIDLLRSSIESRFRLLSICGLADAHPLVTPAGLLSDGQKARLSLAMAIERAKCLPSCSVLVDEFCSTLDRAAAASVASAVRRSMMHGMRFICATAHDDLIEHLCPDILVYVPLEGKPEILSRKNTCTPIPERSYQSTSEGDSSGQRTPIPGRLTSAPGRRRTTTGSPACTTEPRGPRPSSGSTLPRTRRREKPRV